MRYRRLNFGISSAAEISQNVIRETFDGIDGAINISEDILVFRKTLIEHEHNLKAVFQRLRERSDPEQEQVRVQKRQDGIL